MFLYLLSFPFALANCQGYGNSVIPPTPIPPAYGSYSASYGSYGTPPPVPYKPYMVPSTAPIQTVHNSLFAPGTLLNPLGLPLTPQQWASAYHGTGSNTASGYSTGYNNPGITYIRSQDMQRYQQQSQQQQQQQQQHHQDKHQQQQSQYGYGASYGPHPPPHNYGGYGTNNVNNDILTETTTPSYNQNAAYGGQMPSASPVDSWSSETPLKKVENTNYNSNDTNTLFLGKRLRII